MNNQIIPQGPREILTGPATLTKNALVVRALSDCTMDNITYIYPAAPANPAAVDSLILLGGASLEYVKTATISAGNAEVVYLP